MSTLSGTLILKRAVLAEVTEDPNVAPRYIVAGTSGAVGGGSNRIDETTQVGEFRQYGNGNTRLITGPVTTRTQTLVMRALTPDQLSTVRALLGHTILWRDSYGRRLFGAFIDMQATDIPLSGRPETNTLLTDVLVTIQSVTYSEEV